MKRNPDHIILEWLVLSAQLGEKQALNQLAATLYPKLLRYSTRQLGNSEAAADVVQLTLEVLCKDLDRVKDPAAFPKWIYQILHRKGVDYIRGTQSRRRWQSDHDVHTALTEAEDPPAASFIQFEKLLERLDPQAYQVIHLHYLEGLNLNEIAHVLKLAPGTVKSRLHSARQKLKMFIGEGHHD